ncbi:hypothetical protein SARC_01197 [Sphaeroforma arctica JP610]|uniref:Uncharacterized protein n=1 Tax=Sphaeroforma arctica JP610 TaxID=667725 RepID=A0A0L0GCD2_9EUKA|nr:hypothetical protein SARC_01197 [Sphaeroforma arctica JP610]KNC86660.1 hypothetical protein SARC_01197 [Sphaeroforma arctica JP610]|eukprot:XP_014160562.1 hypothetical protein SARC_01197 [Sphaeroforma arctica JP610]
MTYIQSERATRNLSMEIGDNTDKALLVMAGRASTPGTWANNTAFSSYWFSIPYAYAQSGWLLGTLFLLITLGSSWITGLIYGSIINDRYDILLSKRNKELNAIYTRKIEVPLGMRETPIMCHRKSNMTTGPTRGAIMRDEKEVVVKETKSGTLPSATPLDVLTTEVYAKDVTLADLYRDLMGRAGPVIGNKELTSTR